MSAVCGCAPHLTKSARKEGTGGGGAHGAQDKLQTKLTKSVPRTCREREEGWNGSKLRASTSGRWVSFRQEVLPTRICSKMHISPVFLTTSPSLPLAPDLCFVANSGQQYFLPGEFGYVYRDPGQGEKVFWSCLTLLPGPAWLLLNKICMPFPGFLWQCSKKGSSR